MYTLLDVVEPDIFEPEVNSDTISNIIISADTCTTQPDSASIQGDTLLNSTNYKANNSSLIISTGIIAIIALAVCLVFAFKYRKHNTQE